MAAKKRTTNPKKKKRTAKRRARANPSTVRHRARRSSPRCRRVAAAATSGRTRRRARRANPFKRRRARRNPGLPLYAQVALAAGVAAVTYAVVSAGSLALTQRTDPSLASWSRNRNIAAGLATVAGLALAAKKSPIFGAAVAASGGVLLVGSQLGIKLTGLLAKSGGAPAIGEVYGNPMGDYQPMGQVYAQMGAYQPMGEVYGNPMGEAFVPPPPWQTASPF